MGYGVPHIHDMTVCVMSPKSEFECAGIHVHLHYHPHIFVSSMTFVFKGFKQSSLLPTIHPHLPPGVLLSLLSQHVCS